MPASLPSTPAPWHWRPAVLIPSIPAAWSRPLRIGGLLVAVVLALYGALGFVAVPWLAKRQIESLATSELGRTAEVGDVRFNPFTLRGRISDFTLNDREPGRALLKFELLDVNLSSDSLLKRTLLVEDLRIVRPRLEIARDAAGASNVRDLLERPAGAKPAGPRESPFAVNNIEIEDGTVVFDDALLGRRTELTQLSMGVPFLSGRASDTHIRVHPHLKGLIDGAPFALTGAASSPFADSQRATLQLDFDAVPLARYAQYAPLPNGLRLTDGNLTTRLTLAFTTWRGKPRGVMLSGNLRLERLALARADGAPLASIAGVDLALDRLDPIGRSIAFGRVSVTAPEAELRRLADGSLEATKLLAFGATDAAPSTPWAWSIAMAEISGGSVRILDAAVAPAFELGLKELRASAAGIASHGPPGTIEASFDTRDGSHFSGRADVDVPSRAARGHFALTGLPIASLHPYYAAMLRVDVKKGAADVGGDFEIAAPSRALLRQGWIAISDLDTSIAGEREPLLRMARTEATGIVFDPAERVVRIDSIAARGTSMRVLRDADGRLHLERAIAASAAKAGGPAWRVAVQRVLAEDLAADFEDRSTRPAVKTRMSDARLVLENVDTAPGTTANVDLDARIAGHGRLVLRGPVVSQPLAMELAIDATGLDVVPFMPYVQPRTNIVVTSASVDVRGRMSYANPGTPRVRYAGNVIVNRFDSLDRPGAQPLVRWKTLAVTGAELDSEPFAFAATSVLLDRFYARLILSADAKLNVVQLMAAQAAPEAAPHADAPKPQAATAAPAAEAREIPARIDRIQLTHGEVHFSDFFVKPNYSAHLTNVGGTISSLAPKAPGTVQVTALVDGSAPVDIRGTVNPFAKKLALDLTGKATGVDLPPLTPYSVKYAGYGIEKGKLTMEVHYKIEDRKLAASNKLVLDQLTFGDRVDSPTATKLPVLLLVKLLQDRDGVINLELPISGTLDDPQFSIWRVVVQIIVNLLTKAATAPFAILGAIAGGGEQLAYIEFTPGSATLTPPSETKLATLAKVLADRPALHLDAAGRAIAEADGDALRRLALERALKAAKQKSLARAGESAPPLEEIRVGRSDADYAKHLKSVYREADLPGKPRNFIGMAKDIPPEEMEKLLLAGYRVDDNALRELANQRAQAVRDWFTTKGGIPAERVFVAAPKLGTEGLRGDGAPTRVDFGIK